jgi:hypothetical protein
VNRGLYFNARAASIRTRAGSSNMRRIFVVVVVVDLFFGLNIVQESRRRSHSSLSSQRQKQQHKSWRNKFPWRRKTRTRYWDLTMRARNPCTCTPKRSVCVVILYVPGRKISGQRIVVIAGCSDSRVKMSHIFQLFLNGFSGLQ